MLWKKRRLVIDKKAHIEHYGDHAYHLCLAAMVEKYCGFQRFYNVKRNILTEKRG
jgi:hypothetical protein